MIASSLTDFLHSSRKACLLASGALAAFVASALPSHAQFPSGFVNYTTANGLASNDVTDVYVSGSTIYAGTRDGVSISTDGGTNWTNYLNGSITGTVTDIYATGSKIYVGGYLGLKISTDGGANWTDSGLGVTNVFGVYASGSNIYVARSGGVSISTNSGANWTTYSTDNGGLGSNYLSNYARDIYENGGIIYAATQGGVFISTNGGANWTNYTTANGLGSNTVEGIYASGGTIYAATEGGVSISTNGGANWTNYTTGQTSSRVSEVYESGGVIYAAGGGGVSISTNGGANWTNYTTANGLPSTSVRGVYASSGTIYVASSGVRDFLTDNIISTGALSIGIHTLSLTVSTSNITSSTATLRGEFAGQATSPVTARGFVYALASVSEPRIGDAGVTQVASSSSGTGAYSIFRSGLSPNTAYVVRSWAVNSEGTTYSPVQNFSTNHLPSSFANYTTANGLGSNTVNDVLASGGTLYAATSSGVSISTNGGANWTNYTTANGLGSNIVNDLYASGATLYAATNGGVGISTDNGANWTNYTTANGLGSNTVFGVYASGSTLYAGTSGGLSISTNGGANWTKYTTANGLGSNNVYGVYASGSNIYAATNYGVSISTNGGANWTYTTANGLGSSSVNDIYASGSTLYAGTSGGLSISTNGGANWTNYTTANGLGSNFVYGVYASGSTLYAGTSGGLSISINGGANWTNLTTANGLGNNYVNGVYESGGTLYAATIGGLSIGFNHITLAASTSNPTSTSATLLGEFTYPGNSPVTARGFVYALASVSEPRIGDAGVTQVADSGTGSGSYSKLLSGLSPNTAYVFRSYAVNDGGTTYSPVQSFSTNQAPAIVSQGGNANVALSVIESFTAVSTVSATDADAGQTITYSISGGADAARFTIDSASGVLTFAAAPDYEAPADANTDNVYEVVVAATDNGSPPKSATQTLTVTVIANQAPTLVSHGGNANVALSTPEHTTDVTTVSATDTDTWKTITYSISGGADAARFAIDSTSGVVTFVAAPDHEAPADSNADNVYVVIVAATDNGNPPKSATQTLTVTVTNDVIRASYSSASQVRAGVISGTNFTIGTVGESNPQNNWPSAHPPEKAVDGDPTTKFLLFRNANVGLILSPSNSTLAFNRLSFYTANDWFERDPASYVIYGSNTVLSGSAGANIPLSGLTLIASGSLSLPDTRDYGPTVVQFANTKAYKSYLVAFPTVRSTTNNTITQISEVQLWQASNLPNSVAMTGARGGRLSSSTFTLGSIGSTNPGTNWESGNSPDRAIDGDPDTKFLINRNTSAGLIASPQAGPARINQLSFRTASDFVERDPVNYRVYGFAAEVTARSGTLSVTTSGTLLGSGTLTLPSTRRSGPETVSFTNSTAYASYLVVFLTVKNSPTTTMTQISEVQFLDTKLSPVLAATPTSSAVTAATATLGGQVLSSEATVTARGVVISPSSLNGSPTIGAPGVAQFSTTGGTGAFTVEATGLASGTQYSFRAYAVSSAGTSYSSPGSITTVVVQAVPVFSGFTATVTAGKTLSILPAKILARASDPDGGAVTLTQVFGPSAQGGTVSLTGTLNYTPAASFTGTDSFDIELTASQGGTLRATITVTVTADAAAGLNQTELNLHDGVADLTFRGIPGRSYTIQRSTNLTTWTTLATVTAAADGKIRFTDTAPPQPSGYYRTQN